MNMKNIDKWQTLLIHVNLIKRKYYCILKNMKVYEESVKVYSIMLRFAQNDEMHRHHYDR